MGPQNLYLTGRWTGPSVASGEFSNLEPDFVCPTPELLGYYNDEDKENVTWMFKSCKYKYPTISILDRPTSLLSMLCISKSITKYQ